VSGDRGVLGFFEPDPDIPDVSIAVVDVVDSGQRDRILRLALDGLRYQPSGA
jgi:hypothetical protein